MNKMKIIVSVLGIISTAVSLAATMFDGWVDDKKTEMMIDEKIDEKLSAALADKDNEEES